MNSSQASFGYYRQEDERHQQIEEQKDLFRREAHPYLVGRNDTMLHNELMVLARAVYFEELSKVSLHRFLTAIIPDTVWSNQDVIVMTNPLGLGLSNQIADHYISLITTQMEMSKGGN